MRGRHREGPAIDRAIGGARIGEQGGDRLDNPNSPTVITGQARRLVEDLVANGAALHYRAADRELLPSFTYELRPGGDRDRCRSLVAEAKADALLWGAVLKEVAARSGAPGGGAR